MKVKIYKMMLCADHVLSVDLRESADVQSVHVPDKTVERWVRVMDEFWAAQREMDVFLATVH